MADLILQVLNGSDVVGTAVIRREKTKPNEKTGKGGGNPCWKAELHFVDPQFPALRVRMYANGLGADPEKLAAKAVSASIASLDFATPEALAALRAKLESLDAQA